MRGQLSETVSINTSNVNILREAFVFVQNEFAGILKEKDSGYEFEYDSEYLKKENPLSVSLTLPIQNEKFESKTLFPFFDGLIPEGWLLNVVTKNWKIDRKDRFGLLLAVCKDSIGDVSIKNGSEK